MNKDKHVLPDTGDTFSKRIRREAQEDEHKGSKRTIYGPDNEPLSDVNMKKGR